MDAQRESEKGQNLASDSGKAKLRIDHINKRFDLLEKILEQNPNIKVKIAGVPEGNLISEGGKIFPKDKDGDFISISDEPKIDVANIGYKIECRDWYSDDETNNHYIGAGGHLLGTGIAFPQDDAEIKEHLEVLKEIDTRVVGLKGKYKERVSVGGIEEKVEERAEDTIYVWGANAINYNSELNKKIIGRGQADVIGTRTKYTFGICTTPDIQNSHINELDKAWDNDGNDIVVEGNLDKPKV